MQSLSQFQTLPSLVVDMIIEYLQGHPRNSLDPKNKEHNKKKAVLKPFLYVSQIWRFAVLIPLSDSCELRYSHRRKAILEKYPSRPAGFLCPQFSSTSLVKRVVVKASLWSDASKNGFRAVINSPQYKNLFYPSATSLVLVLSTSRNGETIHSFPCDANDMAEFAHSLRQLTPAVTRVAVELNSFCPDAFNFALLYATLVSELTKGYMAGVSINSNTPVYWRRLTRLTEPGLTSIVFGSNINSVPERTLAYRNASTLRELQIGLHEFGSWRGLLYGDTQTPTVYPRLTSLALDVVERQYNPNWAPLDCVDPFPILVTLDISGRYLFNDNLLFRGNGETLVNLSLPFSAITDNALGRFGLVEQFRRTRMNSIHIYQVADIDRYRHPDRLIWPHVHLMLETTAALHFANDTAHNQVRKAIKVAPSTAIIQHLHLGGQSLGIFHIIETVSALPSLISLACHVKGSTLTIEEIPASEHPSELYAKFFSPNSCFGKLRVLDSSSTSAEEVAIVAMQIAVVCPRFAIVDLNSKSRESFRHIVSRALCNESFKPYSGYIRRLI